MSPRTSLPAGSAAGAMAVVAFLVAVAPAAADPALTVPRSKLAAALHCHGPSLRHARREPIMLVTGTGATGEEAYAIGKDAFDTFGHPVCDVDFPNFTTADIQTSVQYLVYGLRAEARAAGRPVAVIGISQGGLLPRVALTYWPGLRPLVSDVVAAAGTQHGSTVPRGRPCSRTSPCAPAVWQQRAGSRFLRALNAQPDESPDPTSWTTVRSAGDEVVQPQTGRHPTSALKGATNILIQSACPGRKVTHIGTALDSVTFAALRDAIAHRGSARVSRLGSDVCTHPYAPGLDEQKTTALIAGAGGLTANRIDTQAPTVRAEPPVRAFVRRRVAGKATAEGVRASGPSSRKPSGNGWTAR